MTACERCWGIAQARGVEYAQQLREASERGEPCTAGTEEGARLRAGQFWDDEAGRDRRKDSRRRYSACEAVGPDCIDILPYQKRRRCPTCRKLCCPRCISNHDCAAPKRERHVG